MTGSDEGPVLGIDLGASSCVMARIEDHGPVVLANAEGQTATPSIVHFYEADGVVVGEEALKLQLLEPETVVPMPKAHLGDPGWAASLFGRPWKPQEVTALVLRKLREDAEALLGENVSDVVLSVPSQFNSAQRGALAEAGAIAGMRVLSLINESTAAAVGFRIPAERKSRNYVIFDLGGASLDVTVIVGGRNHLTTLASDRDGTLGTRAWDARLLNHVAEQVMAEVGADPRLDALSAQNLHEQCRAAKHALSTKAHAVLPIRAGSGRAMVKLERQQLEDLTRDLVMRAQRVASYTIHKAGLRWGDVHDVLLVGGGARMPMIREAVQKLVGHAPLRSEDPAHVVALGTALAGVLRHRPNHAVLRQRTMPPPGPAKPQRMPLPQRPPPVRGAQIGLADGGHAGGMLGDMQIEDRTTHSLGIVVLDQQRKECVVELIPAGTPLPFQFRGRFAYAYENMTAVRVEVTEGHGHHRDDVEVIGCVELEGLPPRPRGTPIEVIYAYDLNQILRVRVIDVETGKWTDAHITFRGGMSEDEVAAARHRTRTVHMD